MEVKGQQKPLHPYRLRKRSPSAARAHRSSTTCAYCGRNFQDSEERRAHESDHLLEPEYRIWECNQCRRKFYSSISLEQHIHSKHVECRFCAVRKEDAGNSTTSIQSSCGNCEREFGDVLAFLQHDQAAHLSCQYCDQIGLTRDRATFDHHCCGCDVAIYSDEELEEHYWRNSTHYHEHPNFIRKTTKVPLNLQKSLVSPAVTSFATGLPPFLETETASGIRLSITPASPVEESSSLQMQRIQSPPSAITPSSSSRYGLLPRRQFSTSERSGRNQQNEFYCPECRIPFQDAETLGRHQGFSFNIIANCDAVFGCPFSLLRHIEMGHCCRWDNFGAREEEMPTLLPVSVENSKGKKRSSGRRNIKDVEMQTA